MGIRKIGAPLIAKIDAQFYPECNTDNPAWWCSLIFMRLGYGIDLVEHCELDPPPASHLDFEATVEAKFPDVKSLQDLLIAGLSISAFLEELGNYERALAYQRYCQSTAKELDIINFDTPTQKSTEDKLLKPAQVTPYLDQINIRLREISTIRTKMFLKPNEINDDDVDALSESLKDIMSVERTFTDFVDKLPKCEPKGEGDCDELVKALKALANKTGGGNIDYGRIRRDVNAELKPIRNELVAFRQETKRTLGIIGTRTLQTLEWVKNGLLKEIRAYIDKLGQAILMSIELVLTAIQSINVAIGALVDSLMLRFGELLDRKFIQIARSFEDLTAIINRNRADVISAIDVVNTSVSDVKKITSDTKEILLDVELDVDILIKRNPSTGGGNNTGGLTLIQLQNELKNTRGLLYESIISNRRIVIERIDKLKLPSSSPGTPGTPTRVDFSIVLSRISTAESNIIKAIGTPIKPAPGTPTDLSAILTAITRSESNVKSHVTNSTAFVRPMLAGIAVEVGFVLAGVTALTSAVGALTGAVAILGKAVTALSLNLLRLGIQLNLKLDNIARDLDEVIRDLEQLERLLNIPMSGAIISYDWVESNQIPTNPNRPNRPRRNTVLPDGRTVTDDADAIVLSEKSYPYRGKGLNGLFNLILAVQKQIQDVQTDLKQPLSFETKEIEFTPVTCNDGTIEEAKEPIKLKVPSGSEDYSLQILNFIRELFVHLCELDPYALVPDSWELKKEDRTPQLIIRFGELLGGGKIKRSNNKNDPDDPSPLSSLTIPHYDYGRLGFPDESPIRSYKKGNIEGQMQLIRLDSDTGGAISSVVARVFAANRDEAERVLTQMRNAIRPEYASVYFISYFERLKVNKNNAEPLEPFREYQAIALDAEWFPIGLSSPKVRGIARIKKRAERARFIEPNIKSLTPELRQSILAEGADLSELSPDPDLPDSPSSTLDTSNDIFMPTRRL